MAKKREVFKTNSNRPTKINVIYEANYLGLYCSNTIAVVHILDQDGKEMLGQFVEVLNTYSNVTRTGTSPLVADFGPNIMKEASFILKIKSGTLSIEKEIKVNDPNFQDFQVIDSGGGFYKEKNSLMTLAKTVDGYECVH